MERRDRAGERRVRVPRDTVGVLPAQCRSRSGPGRLAAPDRRCIGIRQEQVAQVQMEVTVRARVLIEVHDHRPTAGMAHLDRGLLERLPDGRILRALSVLDVTAGLEPASQSAMQVQQHDVPRCIDHDGGRGDMDGQRRPLERCQRRLEKTTKVIDRSRFQCIERRVASEALEQVRDSRVRSLALEGVGCVQPSTFFERTAPVASSS